MELSSKIIRFKRPSRWSAILAYLAILCLLTSLLPNTAYAANASSQRSIVVLEVNGEVTARKSGGQLRFQVYKDMKLGQGDQIETGAGASVTLQTSDRLDEITLGEQSVLLVSDLVNSGEHFITKFKLWAGSSYTKVTPLAEGDRFEVETPTAAMSAKGTQFLTYINPRTGEVTMVVAAGIVQARTIESQPEAQSSKMATVYPAQQINLDSRTQTPDLRTRVNYADPKDIVNQAPPKVIEAFVQNAPDIQKENELMKQKLQEQFNQGNPRPDPNSIFLIKDTDDLNKVSQNFDALLPNIAKEAIDAKKIDQRVIDETNQRIFDPSKRINPSDSFLHKLDKYAGINSEIVNAMADPEKSRYLAEQRQLLENEMHLRELIEMYRQALNKTEEANRQTLAQMQEEASQHFQEQLAAQTPPPSRGGGESGGGSSLTPPPAPDSVYFKLTKGENTAFSADIYLKNFVGTNAIYAIEVQLQKDFRVNYQGDGSVTRDANTVFGSKPGSIEAVKTSGTTVIYAAMNDLTAGNFTVDGEQLLVSIPLQYDTFFGTANMDVKLIYFKAIDKNGKTILEGNHLLTAPVSIPVPVE